MTRRRKLAAGILGAVFLAQATMWGMQIARGAESDSTPAGMGTAAPAGLAACAYEDGPGPCFWDAGQVGNGVGFSFWVDCAQTFHYLDPAADARWGGPGDAYASTCGS